MSVKQKTLDILDASLRTDYKRYHAYPYLDRFKIFSHNIKIDPHWSDQKFKDIPTNFKWSQPYRFADYPDFETIILTNDIGIYMMYVCPHNMIDDMPKHAMYVGISGEHGSARPLKERLMDYFSLPKMKLRQNIHTMLQMYLDHVYIKFCLMPNYSFSDVETLEETFHEYYYPKFGKRDFEPQTKTAQSAWNTGR